jgi:hypothetical protein
MGISMEETMLSKADGFRAQAAECDEQARKTTGGIVRERYIENARWWRELAAQTERRKKTVSSKTPVHRAQKI